MITPGQNTGIILDIQPTDFMVGAETGITFQERNPSGEWDKYRPTDEWQRKLLAGILGYDTMSCVTFSGVRSVAMQIEFLIETGVAPADFVAFLKDKGYIDENGKVNFNENYTAVMSGTMTKGNTAQAVWSSIARDGLLAQSKGPSVNDYSTTDAWLAWKPSQEQIDEAKAILAWLDISYEWVVFGKSDQQEVMRVHLRQAPLHIFTPVSLGWNIENPIHADGSTHLDHATSCVAIESDNRYRDLDHYEPFIKELAHDYYVAYAMKGLVEIKKPQAPTTIFSHVYDINLSYGMYATPEVHALQQGLQAVKDASGKPYMKPGVFGPYGPATRSAVANFQKASCIIDYMPGEHFGPQTRAALTAALLIKQ